MKVKDIVIGESYFIRPNLRCSYEYQRVVVQIQSSSRDQNGMHRKTMMAVVVDKIGADKKVIPLWMVHRRAP